MKKLLIGILIPVVILAGGATTLYFLVRDTSNVSYQKTEMTTKEVMNKNLLSAFSTCKADHNVSFEMSQDDFNQVLSMAYQDMDRSAKEYLRGIEIKIEGDVYHIYVYAKASILSTKLDMACKFSSDEENYYLTVSSIKVGHLSKLKSLAFSILKNAMSESQINDSLSNAGISMKADFEKERFVYKKEDCKNDLKALIKKSMSENTLVSSAVNNLLDMDLLSVDFTSKMQALINLEPLNTNVDFCSQENMLPESCLDLEAQKNKIVSLLNAGILDEESSHPTIVFNYLLRGYSSLEDEEKAYIDSLDLSSIGLDSAFKKKTYTGYQPETANIKDALIDSMSDGSLLTQDGLLIKEKTLNDYLESQGILGYSYLLTGKVDNSYVVDYIAMDNAYFNLVKKENKEQMNMVIGLNINGYETSLIMENTKDQTLDYGITLKNENIYFGTKTIQDDLKNEIYALVKENLPSNEFLTFDGKGTFTINFEGYLKDSIELLSKVQNKKLVLDTTIEGTSLDDNLSGLRIKGSLV